MKPLSYTQIALYRSCPLCYRLQYIDRLTPKKKWYFSFGETLHLCAQFFFGVRVPPPPTLSSLLAFYEANWRSEGYTSVQEEENYRAYGREILTRFWQENSQKFAIPLAVEHMFNINVGGVKLRGYIDRVDKLDSGGLAIIDYKSNLRIFTKDDLENDLQLTFYQMAVEQSWLLPVTRLTLYHLRSNTPCNCPPRDKSRLDEARKLVVDTAENIVRENFPATENAYCPCDFPEYCPYYRQKYAPLQPETEETSIAEAVERFVALQNQIKELEQELEAIKLALTSFCQSQEINRVYGTKHAVTYGLVERTSFPEDEIRTILEPLGLWQKVLAFNPTLLKQLIAGKEIASDLQHRLENLRKVTASYPQLRIKNLKDEE
ncbi:MAG: PD-(D/E)XK nuclease family protein [Chloroflexota bacterium]